MITIDLNRIVIIHNIVKCIRHLSKVLLMCFITFSISNVQAGKVWIGDVNNKWHVAGNWDGDLLPLNGEDITIDPNNYINAPLIVSGSPSPFIPKKVTVKNGAVLTINADLSVADNITVQDAGSTVNMSKGTLNILNSKKLVIKTGAIFNLTGGTVNITDDLTIQDATFNMNENDNTSTLNVDSDNNGSGKLSMKCNAGNTLFNLDAGTVSVGEEVVLDANNKAIYNVTLDISGGSFINNGPTYFERAETDNTYLIISGGITILTGDVSDNGGGRIFMDISGGIIFFQGNVTMQSNDTILQSGGTITFEGGNKDWTNEGTFSATAGSVVFNDPTNTNLLGTGTYDFYNLAIRSGATVSQNGPPNINVAGIWNNLGGTFNENTKTVTFNGTGLQTVSAETFYQMKINKSSGNVSLLGGVAVTNNLIMTAGNIDASSNKITLGTGTGNVGTLTHSSGTIIGKFARWINSTGVDILFPVGTSTFYRPELIQFTNLIDGLLIVEFVSTDPGSSGLPLAVNALEITDRFTEGYWKNKANNFLASSNYDLELTGTGFTSYTIDAKTRILKRTNTGDPWVLEGAHVPATDPTAKRDEFSDISNAQFAFGYTICGPYSHSTSGTNASCFGSSDGSIDLTVSGGLAPYTFAWSNSETTEDISGLTAGAYYVTITDQDFCEEIDTHTITQPTDIIGTAMVSSDYNGEDISCNGAADGAIDLTVVGGIGPYTFVWSNSETTEDISGLVAGTYYVTITDALGCLDTTNTIVTEPVVLTATSENTNITCNGDDDGTIDLTFSGGTSPYSFSWSNSETTEDISGLAPGSYVVTVTPGKGVRGGSTTHCQVY